MVVDSRGVSHIGFLKKSVGYNMKESQRFIFEKYDDARIKSENRLVMAYQAILCFGAHNSVKFQ